MNRWRSSILAGALAVGLLLVGAANIGHWLSAPQSVPTEGDLIVVLGGDAGARVHTALKLYRDGFAQHILLTGLSSGTGRVMNRSLHRLPQYLIAGGVPSGALLFDDRSKNSYEEAHNTARVMESRRWKMALVVSDPPHIRRLAMVWGPACARHGLECRLIATDPPTWDATGWWRDKVWAKFVGMELVKLAYYAMAY